jgi:hypothetical protein
MQDMNLIEQQLTRTLSFFPRVEGRITALATVNTALLALAALNVSAGDLVNCVVVMSGALMVVALLCSYAYLYRANFPDVRGDLSSLVYFAAVEKRTEQAYTAEHLACPEEQYRRDLLGQVWRNSQILCSKYTDVRRATVSTALALVPFLTFLVTTSLLHSRIPVLKG